MNKLTHEKRVQILNMLVEGSSMRSISRVADVSFNTVAALLETGRRGVRGVPRHGSAEREGQAGPVRRNLVLRLCQAAACRDREGSARRRWRLWTWTAVESGTKLLIAWQVGPRDAGTATAFMQDVKERLANRVQLTTDGLRAYLAAVEDAFGADIDYAMLDKLYGAVTDAPGRYSPAACIGAVRRRVEGRPDPDHVQTSHRRAA